MLADFRGVKKVYYNGSYHDSVRFGNELIWETEKEMEGILRREEVDLTGLTEVNVNNTLALFYADNSEYGSGIFFSSNHSILIGENSYDYRNKEAFKFISINDCFIKIDSEEIKPQGRSDFYLEKITPPSYLERLFGLPFPYGALYEKDKLTENNKISVWIREEV